MDEIRKEIQKIEESAERIKTLAQGNNAILKNATIILNFIYLLKYDTPVADD